MDAVAYQQQLKALSPQGLAWNLEADSEYSKLLQSFSEALGRFDGDIQQVIEELDPRTATELLPEWERLLELPDPCAIQPQTLQQRREAAHSKYISRGAQSRAYFISLAKSLGYEVTIDTYQAFITGLSYCGEVLNPINARFVWRVNVTGERSYRFRAGESACGEQLLKIVSATQLECTFRKLQPSHSNLFFNYS